VLQVDLVADWQTTVTMEGDGRFETPGGLNCSWTELDKDEVEGLLEAQSREIIVGGGAPHPLTALPSCEVDGRLHKGTTHTLTRRVGITGDDFEVATLQGVGEHTDNVWTSGGDKSRQKGGVVKRAVHGHGCLAP